MLKRVFAIEEGKRGKKNQSFHVYDKELISPVGCILYLRGKKRQEDKGTGKPRKQNETATSAKVFELCCFFCGDWAFTAGNWGILQSPPTPTPKVI